MKIIKDAPIPLRSRRKSWPLEKLKIGESFRISRDDKPSSMNGLYSVAKNHGMQLSYRTLDDGSVQVWRVK